MSNIYQAPTSDLSENVTHSDYGSLEKGLSGNYQLTVADVINESWRLTKGTKWTFNLALSVYGLLFVLAVVIAMIPIFITLAGMTNVTLSGFFMVLIIVFYLGLIIATTPMTVALIMMGINRATDQPISVGMLFSQYHKTFPLFAVILVSGIFINIGSYLLIIPGIYLAIAYALSAPLVAEKDLSFWRAMETSRKAITHKWFTMFGIVFVLLVLNMIAMLPFGIGLIWTIPMSFIAIGITYRNIFGLGTETLGTKTSDTDNSEAQTSDSQTLDSQTANNNQTL
ncbi:hypothetical protein [Sessilibacter corallicola]|uniref:hypothetical protein n=1 Tax=Sessilibacter corallicola TaxID=2904075 RepID=UPI001E4DEBC2|nr:hypothetical protein [Sessilibacter corallicola]MCE2029540.1 hypothetical protein [Sessilibacter corallicola]